MLAWLIHGKAMINVRNVANKCFLNAFFMMNYLHKVEFRIFCHEIVAYRLLYHFLEGKKRDSLKQLSVGNCPLTFLGDGV